MPQISASAHICKSVLQRYMPGGSPDIHRKWKSVTYPTLQAYNPMSLIGSSMVFLTAWLDAYWPGICQKYSFQHMLSQWGSTNFQHIHQKLSHYMCQTIRTSFKVVQESGNLFNVYALRKCACISSLQMKQYNTEYYTENSSISLYSKLHYSFQCQAADVKANKVVRRINNS